MLKEATYHIDEETISSLGLRLTDKPVSSQLATHARVYEFPALNDVFVMESDFYGNPMPEGSCFLAFLGKHGLLGRNIRVEKLRSCSIDEIEKMVQDISEG